MRLFELPAKSLNSGDGRVYEPYGGLASSTGVWSVRATLSKNKYMDFRPDLCLFFGRDGRREVVLQTLLDLGRPNLGGLPMELDLDWEGLRTDLILYLQPEARIHLELITYNACS